MKYFCLFLVVFFCSPSQFYAQVNPNHVWVNGYWEGNKYHQGYFRTAPNNTINDNFSTEGNINPYTGKPGSIPREVDSYGDLKFNSVKVTPYNVAGIALERLTEYPYVEIFRYKNNTKDINIWKSPVRSTYLGEYGSIYKSDATIESIKLEADNFKFVFSSRPDEIFTTYYDANNVNTFRNGEVSVIIHRLTEDGLMYIVQDDNYGIIQVNILVKGDGLTHLSTDVFNKEYSLYNQLNNIHWKF